MQGNTLSMPDHLTIEQRHYNMSRIRGKDTKPEMIVRQYLWSHGFRYRLNYQRLPGKPDLVLRKYRTCIFVNGCFWHGHHLAELEIKNEELKMKNGRADMDDKVAEMAVDHLQNSPCCKIPRTNREFWVKKIMRNKERDREVQRKLAVMGWHSIVVWECELKPNKREQTLTSLAYTLNHIFLEDHKVRKYDMEDEPETLMAAEDDESLF